MFRFDLIKKSKKSRARLGILKTSHGEVETPVFVPVATRAVIKTLDSEEVLKTRTQLAIANTFHLHLRPGEDVVKKAGGLHKFMNWDKPLMTDSGGFQVFSLGFGLDQGVGKILKTFPGKATQKQVKLKTQPQKIKITYDGVHFRSIFDGTELFIGPKESMLIQEKLGADIIFAFDECTSPLSDYEYIKESLERTHRWAKICLQTKKSPQALFGITQGSRFKDLREESARFINSLDFDGFGIGGDLGTDKVMTQKILRWTIPLLDERKPRHLLGIGYPEDMERIIKEGVDLFDCTLPTHYARRGIAFIPLETGTRSEPSRSLTGQGSFGRLNFREAKFLKDQNPIDKKCDCDTCVSYKRNYICHLIRANEITGMKLITFHNLYFFNTLVENIREKIKRGTL